ncbi:leucine-rich repeat domain-containing protein, partial [Capnocytophaga sputigena]|uniref:leucine-rich repeat domain-containing protein n=1 Tax=Capnocytophaga sputigena TaxID=1019 RepID=UPI0028EEC28A
MKKLIFITVAVLGALAVSNCGKETEKVIERVEVQKGNQILSGIGAPDASLGNVGDYYLDKSTGELYGAKTAQGWGTPINLKGQDGANGSNGQNGSSGTKILSGTTTPTTSQGEVGDWYIDTQNKRLYGPKTESGWGTSFITLGEGNTPQPQPQPQTISPDDYELSNNGRMLSKWKNKNFTSIDMQADEVLRNVTDISTYVFQNHTNLTSIVLPEGLKTIGGSAFEGCNLKSVVIPNGVREIGPYAFNKNQLTAVTIPNSVTRIWYSAFSNNKLTSVIIPNGVTIIENNVFSNNKLTSIVIPDGVTKI